MSEKIKSKTKISKGKKIIKKDQGDILGKRFDKKLLNYAGSKESQLHAKDFDEGVNKAENRALKEVIQEAGMPMSKFAKGGRAGYKMGGKCKLATKGKGRAYGKNS